MEGKTGEDGVKKEGERERAGEKLFMRLNENFKRSMTSECEKML